MNNIQTKLKVFFDGSCHLCDREIKYYIKQDSLNLITPIDITSKDFDAKSYKLNEKDVNTHLHAVNELEEVFTKVDAFIEIWMRIPKFNYLAVIANKPAVKWLLDKGYIVFAEFIRPYLPKKKCTEDSCAL